MSEGRLYSWRNAWFRWSVSLLAVLTVVSVLVGFVVLPSAHADFSAKGLWDSICRAAGVPATWSTAPAPSATSPTATDVVLVPAMARTSSPAAVGRGGTLALNCTMCHGAQGISRSDAPNLSGQYAEVIIKQMHDYKTGKRTSSIMQALARDLSEQDIADLAAYYAERPKARNAPTTYDEPLPALVRVGDPLRNIAPCISCHGSVDQKLGTPWIEGMPKEYLVTQLRAFRQGERRNDASAQMRNMARAMSDAEIDAVASFYARKAGPGEGR